MLARLDAPAVARRGAGLAVRQAARCGAADAGEDEAAFLRDYDVERFPRPSVAVDVALLSVRAGALWTLTVQRRQHPYAGWHALPGGFLGIEESLDDAAARVLAAKAALQGVWLEQLYTFGQPRRDPRTRVLSVAYFALVDEARLEAAAQAGGGGELARVSVPWAGETGGPVRLLGPRGARLRLAFDHAAILGMAVKRLRGKLDYAPVGFQLLPPRFTLLDLQRVHEAVSGARLDKSSFRRRMLASGLLVASGETQHAAAHRPAALYEFKQRSAT
jgi:8-oxo-dGTP diphosphatase